MLEESVVKFMSELTENGKIYLLSKLAGITTGCGFDKGREGYELIAFSTASNLIICSIVEQSITMNDKIMVDSFIAEHTQIPDNVIGMVNDSIDSLKIPIEKEEFDVMYV